MNKKDTHIIRNNRVFYFKLIAVCLPFFILFLLEASLRFFHYGYNLDLFIEHPANNEYLVVNSSASKRYFLDPTFAPTGNKELFKKKKAPNTLRLFVLGESTTVGYPYFHNGSFHRWLLYRLMHTYPDTNFEIINLSLTAVNSYTVLGYAKEIVNYEPDAVLIYTGQNEYYGGLGVASSQSIGGNPAMINSLLKIRDFRIIQLLLNGYRELTNVFQQKTVQPDQTRMEFMVGDQKIVYQSDLYEKGLNQFRYNIDLTLRILDEKNIPVFMSNLVSNIKDLPPFIGNEEAIEAYKTGHSLREKGEYTQAENCFIKAKELDELRFRAPEKLNDIIQELCNQYSRCYFVDTQNEFKKHAPHQILGDELFTDHVHPNLEGYRLMSYAFYNTMKDASFFDPLIGREISEEQVFQEMPVSPIDSIAAEFRLRQLKSHWPYNDERFNTPIPENTPEEKLAARLFRKEDSWLDLHNVLYSTYIQDNNPFKAAKIVEGVILEYAEDPAFYEQASMVYGQMDSIKQAAFYLQKSFKLSASLEKAHYLFVYYLMLDDPSESLPYLNYAITSNTNQLKLEPIKPLVQQAIFLKQKLEAEPQDVSTLIDMANTYLEMDNRVGALKYADKIMAIEPNNTIAQKIKEHFE